MVEKKFLGKTREVDKAGEVGPFTFWTPVRGGAIFVEKDGEEFNAGDRNVLSFVPALGLVGAGGGVTQIKASGRGKIERDLSDTTWCRGGDEPEFSRNNPDGTFDISWGTCCPIYMCDGTQYFSLESFCIDFLNTKVDVVKFSEDGLQTLARNVGQGWCAPPEVLKQLQPACTVNSFLKGQGIEAEIPVVGETPCILALLGGVGLGITLLVVD